MPLKVCFPLSDRLSKIKTVTGIVYLGVHIFFSKSIKGYPPPSYLNVELQFEQEKL